MVPQTLDGAADMLPMNDVDVSDLLSPDQSNSTAAEVAPDVKVMTLIHSLFATPCQSGFHRHCEDDDADRKKSSR